jgi:hypothetical protein
MGCLNEVKPMIEGRIEGKQTLSDYFRLEMFGKLQTVALRTKITFYRRGRCSTGSKLDFLSAYHGVN